MKDSPFWTNLTAAASQPAAAPLSAPYSESIVIIIMIIFNRNINHWTCDHVVIMWFGWNTTKSLFQLNAISPSVRRILLGDHWDGLVLIGDVSEEGLEALNIQQTYSTDADSWRQEKQHCKNFEVTGFCISISNAETYTPACLTV